MGFAPLDSASVATQNQATAAAPTVDEQAAVAEAKSAELPVVVEAPVALPPPANEETPQKSATNAQGAIVGRIQAWAQAWQQRRVSDYYSFYTADFRGDQTSHTAWRKQRNDRIMGAADIRIRLDGLKVELQDADNAVAGFRQTYQSASLTDVGIKTLRLKRVGGVWLIADEQFRK